MSYRNRRDVKKLHKLSKSLTKGRLPRYLDLIKWLEDRGHADTAGAAKAMMWEGRVVANSHPLGTKVVDNDDGEATRVLDRFVPADLRSSIEVTEPVND